MMFMSGEATPLSTENNEEIRQVLQHRERQLEAIRQVSDALFTHPGTEPLARETLLIALNILRAEAGAVYLHDPVDNTLICSYVIGGSNELIGTRIPANNGIAGEVFSAATARLGTDTLTVPIHRTNAAPVGVMQILNATTPPFTARDLEVLESLCTQAATGIEYFQVIEASRKAEVINVIGDVSHDIKNMLSPITTGVQTLEPLLDRLFADLENLRIRCGDTEDVQNIAEEINQLVSYVRNDYGWILQNVVFAAEQVQARTKEIADVVKGDIAAPYFEAANLNETCELVVQTMQAVAQKHQVTLVLEADETLPLIDFDRRQTYGALYNLVNNAIPETPAGGKVTVCTYQPDTDTIAITVSDTGRGIPEHVKLRLFTAEAISTKPGGTGLGTRIVMGVVRRHNGTITVDTEVGKGSTFTITLPRKHL